MEFFWRDPRTRKTKTFVKGPVAYERIGEGPDIILTHGWMMSRKVWEKQQPLSQSFRLLVWDLPGHGDSPRFSSGEAGSVGPDSPIGLDACAKALYRLLQELKITSAVYVGWSMGMSVFWRYCEIFGAKPFTQVVNVEMLPMMDPKQARISDVEKSMQRDRRHAMRKFAQRIFFRLDEANLEGMIDEAEKVSLETSLRLYKEMAEADFTQVMGGLKILQHLAFGRRGFYADHEEIIRWFFPEDPLHWFENSAHAPFWEEPEKFNDLLQSLTVSGHSR